MSVNSQTNSWQWFDGANSILHLIGLTILLPWLFDTHWTQIVEHDPLARALGESGDKAWGYTVALSVLISSILSFVVGRYADSKKKIKTLGSM